MKRQITWLAIVVLGVAAFLDDPADDLYWMDGYGGGRPALIGYWQTKTFVFGVLTPSGGVTATGTEEFDGCLDANGDRSCGASEPSGTLRFSFEFSGKYDLGWEFPGAINRTGRAG